LNFYTKEKDFKSQFKRDSIVLSNYSSTVNEELCVDGLIKKTLVCIF